MGIKWPLGVVLSLLVFTLSGCDKTDPSNGVDPNWNLEDPATDDAHRKFVNASDVGED
jgi:hypothetical protein